MRNLFLFMFTLFVMSAHSQEKEIAFSINVIPSESEHFNVDELKFRWLTGETEEVNWNASNNSFEGTVTPLHGNAIYEIYTPDERILFLNLINKYMSIEETYSDTADFSNYHYVSVSTASEDYNMSLTYLGVPRTNDVIGESMFGVKTNLVENATYCTPGDYECDARCETVSGNIPMAVEPQFFKVGNQDMYYKYDAGLDEMHLATISARDHMGDIIPGMDISWANLSETLTLTTDNNGDARIYLKDGEYLYYPSKEDMVIIESPNLLGKLNVSGSDLRSVYSFKDKGWYKYEFNIAAKAMQEVSLTVKPPYMMNDYYLEETYIEDNKHSLSFYAPAGRYLYTLKASHKYNGISYLPINGVVEIDGNGSTDINFSNADNVTLDVRTDYIGDSIYVYDVNNVLISINDFEKIGDFNRMSPINSLSEGDGHSIELSLPQGQYTLVLYASQDDKKVVLTKEVEVSANGGSQEVTFYSQDFTTGTLEFSVKNVMEMGLENSLLGYIYNSEGHLIDVMEKDSYYGYPVYMLSSGDYCIKWRNTGWYNYFAYKLLLKYDQTFSVSEDETYSAVLDFDHMAVTKVELADSDSLEIWGFNIRRNGKEYYTESISESYSYLYVAGEPGEYQLDLWGRAYDSLNMDMCNETISFTQTEGSENSLYASLDKKNDNMVCLVGLYDIFGNKVENATLTINGNVYSAEDCNILYVKDISDADVMDIKVEAEGYKTYTIKKDITEMEKDVFNMQELVLFIEPGMDDTGISSEKVSEISVMRTSSDNILISNGGNAVCNYQIVDMQGITLANGTVKGESVDVSLAGMPSGIYVVVVENGSFRKTIKIAK